MLDTGITDRKSFDQLPRWLRDARMEADPHCSVILVGNKTDLSATRVVSKEEAEEFAKSHELQYIETSAAENTRIAEVFMKTGAELLRKVASGQINAGAPSGTTTVSVKREVVTAQKNCNC